MAADRIRWNPDTPDQPDISILCSTIARQQLVRRHVVLRQSIDPEYSQFFLDTCAFDPKYAPEDKSAAGLWQIFEDGILHLVLAHSNQCEIDHPSTPA